MHPVILTGLYNKDTETTTEITLPPHSSSKTSGSSKIENPKNENEEEDELDQLILIWNETVQAKLKSSPIFPTDKRKITLRSVFRHLFKGDVASWKSYCEKIAGTKFLMGQSDSGFKAGFDWAINPDNVAKILEGAIYDKPSSEVSSVASTELPWEEFANALWARHTLKGYPASWTKVCLNLAKKTNQSVSEALFEKIYPKDLTGQEAELTVPFQFILDQIQQRHKPKLEDAIRAEYPHVQSIEIGVGR